MAAYHTLETCRPNDVDIQAAQQHDPPVYNPYPLLYYSPLHSVPETMSGYHPPPTTQHTFAEYRRTESSTMGPNNTNSAVDGNYEAFAQRLPGFATASQQQLSYPPYQQIHSPSSGGNDSAEGVRTLTDSSCSVDLQYGVCSLMSQAREHVQPHAWHPTQVRRPRAGSVSTN